MAASSSYRNWGLSRDSNNAGDSFAFAPHSKTQLVVLIPNFSILSNVFYRVKNKSLYIFKHKVHLKSPAFNKNDSLCRMVNYGGNTRIDLHSNNGTLSPTPTPAPEEYSYVPV